MLAAGPRIQNVRQISERVAMGRALWRELVIGFASQLGELRLGFTQLAALYVLADGSTTTVGELAESLGRSPSATSRLVDGLVRRRLVERHEEPEDRRQRSLALTQRGQALLRAVDRARADQFLTRGPAAADRRSAPSSRWASRRSRRARSRAGAASSAGTWRAADAERVAAVAPPTHQQEPDAGRSRRPRTPRSSTRSSADRRRPSSAQARARMTQRRMAPPMARPPGSVGTRPRGARAASRRRRAPPPGSPGSGSHRAAQRLR